MQRYSAEPSHCPKCFLTYRDPRVLSCGHSFCKECIADAVVVKSLSCPTCEKSSHVPHGDVTKLVKNLTLTGLVDSYQNPYTMACLKCSECNDYERREAAVHCYSCQKSLCSLCSSAHENFRHSVVDVEKYELESLKVRDVTTLSLVGRTTAKEKALDQRMNLIENQMQRVKSVSSNTTEAINKSFDNHIQRLEDLRDHMVEETEDRQDFLLGKLRTVQEFTKTFKDMMSKGRANIVQGKGRHLRGDTLKNHIKLCHELEMILEDDIDIDMLTETSAFAEGFEYSAPDVKALSLGSIGTVDVGWRLRFDIAVQPGDAIRSMCATPDGRIAIGFSKDSGGLALYAPDKRVEVPEAMQGILVRSVAFLPDGTCAVLDLNNTLSLHTSKNYDKLYREFETLSSDDAGVGQLSVDEHHFLYVAYKMDRRIHKFSPMGGRPREDIAFQRVDPIDIRVSQEGAVVLVSWRKILVLGPSGSHIGELQHNATDQLMVADVSSDETLIVGFLSQWTGEGGLDRLTVRRFNLDAKLTLKETLFTDHPIALSPTPFYCIRELITGEIAFCTKNRLYLFQYHLGLVKDVGFSDFGAGYQHDRSRDVP